jgi:hypothetical protein
MPFRWLLPLAIALGGVAPATVAQQPLPPGSPPAESLPETVGLVPALPDPPAGPCDCLIPPAACRPRLEPDYVQFLSGVSRKSGLGPTVPTFDFTPITARVGWYLTDPMAPGAVSVLFDYSTDIVTNGFGHFVTGPAVAIRYERRPDRVLVPYVHAGVGLAFNDAYRDQKQRAIGALTEFYDHAGAGVRYRFAPHWSLDAEVLLQHISNASTASRNLGVTNVGYLGGLTYTFGGP